MASWKTAGLMLHEDARRPRQERAYWCPRCGQEFERFDELQHHMLSIHFAVLHSSFNMQVHE
jgi:hypothetical protein